MLAVGPVTLILYNYLDIRDGGMAIDAYFTMIASSILMQQLKSMRD